MKKFSELNVGDEFFSEGKISLQELENYLSFYGMDGDPTWQGRHARFLKPLYTDEVLKMKFKISEKTDLNENYGFVGIDFEGTKENGDVVVVARRNLYQIKKDPPTNQ